MHRQTQILRNQTKLLTSPIIDANARIKEDGKIRFQIANVGNYAAKNPKIVVEIDTPNTVYRYICNIFPSLPPKSLYTSGVSHNYFEIKPFFWIPKSENTKKSGNILELMDYLCKIGYGEYNVRIMIYLQASNHETVKLFTGETVPSHFRDYVRGRFAGQWRLKVRPRNPIKLLLHILSDKISAYQERRKKKVEEFSESIELNISKL